MPKNGLKKIISRIRHKLNESEIISPYIRQLVLLVKKKERPIYPSGSKDTVFVTGDVGKLGTFVTKKLSKEFNIVGFDRAVSNFEHLGNEDLLKSKMNGAKYVVHLAAIPHPNISTFADYIKINVLGTMNVLKAAAENGVKRVVYISSTAYYGCDIKGRLLPLYFPIDERHPIASTPGLARGALSAYDQSKVMAEQICSYFGTNDILELVVLRSAPANTNEEQYPKEFDWRRNKGYQRGVFWANNHPKNLAQATYLSIKSKKRFKYEVFNVANRYTDHSIDVSTFLSEEYPNVPISVSLKNNPSLISTDKIRKSLNFRSIDEEKRK